MALPWSRCVESFARTRSYNHSNSRARMRRSQRTSNSLADHRCGRETGVAVPSWKGAGKIFGRRCRFVSGIAQSYECLQNVPNSLSYELRRELLFREKGRMHPDDQHFFVVAAIENANVSAIWQTLHAAPQIIVVEIVTRRRFERIDLATLWIHAGHDMLDRSIFSGGVHSLEDQEYGPFVLCIELTLQFRQCRHAQRERFLRQRLVCFFREFQRVVRIDVLQPEILSFANTEWLGELTRSSDDFLCFHNVLTGSWRVSRGGVFIPTAFVPGVIIGTPGNKASQ